jgi:type VI secretion system protein ImpL
MMRLLNIFKNSLFQHALGLLALSLLIWFSCDFIKFGENNTTLPYTIRAIIILALVLTWTFAILILQWRAQRNNSDMIEAIQNVEEDRDSERTKEEIAALNQRFSDAMSVLKKAKLTSGGKNRALYELPWYIVIGPPGAGKTTALINSDLDFPLSETHGKASLGGVGGTRNCDWWFTNESVLIDTAGRYTTQDSHRVIDNSAWHNFLKLLKKFRPLRPINGVVIAISLQDLITQTPEQRDQQAKTIRERLNELQQELGIRFPVYILLTKCDLIAGFSEFFANLTQSERQQIWGITFNSENNKGILDSLATEYKDLIRSLNERVLWRMHNERDPAKRALIQSFPSQMDNLTDTLCEFCQQLISPNLYSQQPLFRGLYLSSGTQEGTPIDRMMSSVSASFGFGRDTGKIQNGSGKSFFINHLFKDIIFPEAELVGSNKKLEQTTSWLRRGYFATLAVSFLAAIITWSVSVSRNNTYMTEVRQLSEQYKQEATQLSPADTLIDSTLATLSPVQRASNVYNQKEHPWLQGLGLYDNSVDQAADKLYVDALTALFLPRLITQLELELARLSIQELTDDTLLSALRCYLMFTDREHRRNQVILKWFKSQWEKTYPRQASKQQQLLQHLETLLSANLDDVRLSQTTITLAQQKLKQVPIAQRLYNQLLAGNAGLDDRDLYALIGGTNAALLGHDNASQIFSMPVIFTAEGYKELDLSANTPLLKKLEEDRWIYGGSVNEDFSDADKAKLANELKTLYLNDYNKHWKEFLDAFSVRPFSDLADTSLSLKQLSDPVYSPFLAVLSVTKDNTQLTPDWSGTQLPGKKLQKSKLGKAAKLAGELASKHSEPTPVDIEFRTLNELTHQSEKQVAASVEILTAIRDVYNYVNEITIASNSQQAAFEASKARFSGAGIDPIKNLYLLASRAPAPVDSWLKEIGKETWKILLDESKVHLDKSWEQQVYQPYREQLANYYPMAKNAKSETTVAVFNQFFNHEGIQATFVENNIKPFVDTREWTLKTLEGNSLAITDKGMNGLKQASWIRKAFFPNGSATAQNKFTLKPRVLDSGVGRFELRLADERFVYTHGPKISKKAQWIAGETSTAGLFFEDLNRSVHQKNYDGEWAWLRLLDTAKLQRKRGALYHATFQLGSRKAQYELRGQHSLNAFNLPLLRGYRVGKHL